MAASLSTVALLVASPALASILQATLAVRPNLRVRIFDSAESLLTYLSIAGADLVLLDYDAEAGAEAVALRMGAEGCRPGCVMALANGNSGDLRAATLRAGIDEVLMKPMSPKYLVERVQARLATPRLATPLRRPNRRVKAAEDWSQHGTNIVPLFGSRPEARL